MSEETPTRYAGRELKVREVAAILRVDEATVRVWIRAGILEASTVPHTNGHPSYRIAGEVVDKLLQVQDMHEDATPS